MAIQPHPLDILFLTNFSDFCFRTIPSIAQMYDELPVRLTIMHAYDPAATTARQATEALQSFFPEADRYRSCRRVAVPGKLVHAIQRHLEIWPVSLVVAPASDSIGIPRIGERSMRARLLDGCELPLWTMGRGIQRTRLARPVRNVACWLDFYADHHPQLPYAIELARSVGATLHLLRGLPAIDEGQMMPPGHPDKALNPAGAAEEMARLCKGAPVPVEIHVLPDDRRASIARLLTACDADIVFLRHEEGALSRWLKVGLRLRLGDTVPCPAIYVGDKSGIPVWNLEAVRRPRLHAPVREVVPVRGRASLAEAHAAVALPRLAEIGIF